MGEEESEDDDIEMRDLPKTPKRTKKNIFKGKSIVVSGTGQSAKKIKISANGGTVKTSMSKTTDFVIVDSDNPDLGSSKCRSAKKLKKPILSADYLDDCIAKQKLLYFAEYVVGESDNEQMSEVDSGLSDNDVKATN